MKKSKICMTNIVTKNVILVGLGPYAIDTYLKFHQNNEFKICGIIDLKSKEKEIKYLINDDIKLLLVDDNEKDNEVLSASLVSQLEAFIKKCGVSHAIIATEPKAHYAYAKFFIENDINVLIEKPVIVTKNILHSDSSRKDYLNKCQELLNAYKKHYNNINVTIMSQRRYNNAYIFLKKYIKDIIEKYNIGITSMHISSSDGTWNMPNEFFTRENHPYKYGYGKLMHSGYHYVDLAMNLLQENKNLINKKISSLSIKSSCITVSDYFKMIDNDNYKKMFNEDYDSFKKNVNEFGELDFHSILDFKDNNGHTLTTISLDLIQNSISRRSWTSLPQDTYRNNGRIKQNFIDICMGPLINIKIIVEQAFLNDETNDSYNLGGKNNFEIIISRNQKFLGGKVLEKYGIQDFETSNNYYEFNDYCRLKCIKDFLNNPKSKSDLSLHQNTMKLLAYLYESISNNIEVPFQLMEDNV